ncbi:tRNA (adenosine(37)-N6)-threonylcarbamoyltransferase complex dimerization subunit type 1 TsaB [Buchnera aphidicola (Ceratoglyphina bambusae)]|uniref:tRNA (adenosine(37)-N6)-threonylcarbamoyltransferase complex dimerization subunit type 1 TsaB n=1 Tax=Buchnera aphidicola TaxID=9 RepID=UPI0031B88386
MKNKILSLESSNNSCSVSIEINNKLDYIFDKCKNNYEEKILPMIKNILNRNCVKINDFNIISYSNGPGSFSGIRLSSGIAKSFFLINKNIKLFPISSLEIIAENCWKITKNNNIIVLIKNKNNYFFYGKYFRKNNGIWLGEKTEKLIKLEQALKKIIKTKKINFSLTGNFKKNKIKKYFNKKKYKNKFKYTKINFPNAKYMIYITKNMLEHKMLLKNFNNDVKYLTKI